MSLSRRRFLGSAGAAGLLIPLAAACDSSAGDTGGNGDEGRTKRSATRLPSPFSLPLAIPPVLEPVRTDAGTDYYELTARLARLEILPGLRTEVFGYNGIFPGPTINARSGRRVVVRTRNELPVPISTHLHGGRTPADSDGYPTDLILPVTGWSGHQHGGNISEGTREYVYPSQQRAATLWYHDHRMDFTGPQVWRGLAGFHLLRDDEEDALPLPSGPREVPLMIADRSFAEDGSFVYPSIDPDLRDKPGVTGDAHNGMLGDVILVNGVPWPFFEVEAARYRLRLLNGSNARRYRLELDPEPDGVAPFIQIGSDGGLLEAPRELNSIYLTPAERFDVVVDFSRYRPGTTVVLRNDLDGGSVGQVMQFRVTGNAGDESAIPSRLSTVERLDPGRAVRTRTFRFSHARQDGQDMHLIDSRTFTPDFIAADPKLGETEIWAFKSSNHHPIHVHLSPFQVLERKGDLEPEDVGWKDTVRLKSNDEVKVLVRFDGYPGKYVFHCHNLEHEDRAMMANFEVS